MNIYEELWDLDQRENGMTVSCRDQSGKWINPDADILVEEQNKYTRGTDKAPNPLFYHVNEEKLQGETYTKFISLLDNYLINPFDLEDDLNSNRTEIIEIREFLNRIIRTSVMDRAYEYITGELGESFTIDIFKTELIRIWFELFDNYYNGNKTPGCSGFEHVFVGEGKKNDKSGIGGYHYWLKFFLDETEGTADFKGYNYKGSQVPEMGSSNPDITTISMEWLTNDSRKRASLKRKDLGGFFIGLSPEGQIAIATVLFYESLNNSGNFTGGTDRKTVIKGQLYSLVMYRETPLNKKNNSGSKIRSFFQKYLKPESQEEHSSNYSENTTNRITISKALINPSGYDSGKEWIEINNNSKNRISLKDWKMMNKLKEIYKLEGEIDPNKSIIIYPSDKSFKLTNKSGIIKILNGNNKVETEIKYKNPKINEILFFS